MERRVIVEPGPIARSSWRREGDVLLGSLEWNTCSIDRRWTTTKTRVERTTPRTGLGIAEIAGGVGLLALGASLAFEEKRDCGTGMQGAVNQFYGTCRKILEPQPEGQILGVVGIGFILAGIATVARQPSVEEAVISTSPEHVRSTGRCITPEDLRELALVLRYAPGKLLPVRLNARGEARIELPEDVELPGDALPIAVYRVPRGARGLLERGQVIAHVRVAGDASAEVEP